MLIPRSGRPAGFSLIELMIGMVVALIVLWGLSAVYVNASRGSRIANTAMQLNQDLRAVMDIMVNDIRRAGFWAAATSGPNPFMSATTNIELAAGADCMLYSYDATHAGGLPGVVDSSGSFMDFFGFRLSEGAVQTVLPTAGLTTSATTAACADDALWEDLTDARALTVTALEFETTGSQCIAYLPATYQWNDATTFTTWTTTAGISPACIATAAGAPSTYPLPTHTFVETRQVSILLSARSNTDASLTRTLSETVLVRNNRVISP